MTKKELIKALEQIGNDEIIVCADDTGCWGNITEIGKIGETPAIIFGNDLPFSDDK